MNSDQWMRERLKADAGALPGFDEAMHMRVVDVAMADRRALQGRPSPNLSRRERDRKWWIVGAGALAACVVVTFFLRSPTPPPGDWSASVAAITAAARPPVEFASLPMRPYHQNLAALTEDSQRLARFVTSQLDVMPHKASITN